MIKQMVFLIDQKQVWNVLVLFTAFVYAALGFLWEGGGRVVWRFFWGVDVD